MNSNDSLIAKAQIGLAFAVLLSFVAVLIVMLILLVSPKAPNQALLSVLTGLLATLGTIFTLQMNYFFARHRPQGLPDQADPDSPGAPALAAIPSSPTTQPISGASS
jgi:hypothetical protein